MSRSNFLTLKKIQDGQIKKLDDASVLKRKVEQDIVLKNYNKASRVPKEIKTESK